jgi:oxygen-independent coproporphyrinogen-3 oxidase
LSEDGLDGLLALLNRRFVSGGTVEFTVEAGRPDTFTPGKLEAMARRGVDRVCVNPQSMNRATLARIGRDHGAEEVAEAFRIAREAGLPVINADLIAGLPGEGPEDFRRSLTDLLELDPENITVHSLAVKRAAKLRERDAEFSYGQAEAAEAMLDIAGGMLGEAGYEPYYLYRLKRAAGNLENTGYARGKAFCLYNIRAMEENQTIIALGAGASTKVFFPDENRIERVFNVANYELYIRRVDEMIERKRRLLFGN